MQVPYILRFPHHAYTELLNQRLEERERLERETSHIFTNDILAITPVIQNLRHTLQSHSQSLEILSCRMKLIAKQKGCVAFACFTIGAISFVKGSRWYAGSFIVAAIFSVYSAVIDLRFLNTIQKKKLLSFPPPVKIWSPPTKALDLSLEKKRLAFRTLLNEENVDDCLSAFFQICKNLDQFENRFPLLLQIGDSGRMLIWVMVFINLDNPIDYRQAIKGVECFLASKGLVLREAKGPLPENPPHEHYKAYEFFPF